MSKEIRNAVKQSDPYAWEASNKAIARENGLKPEEVVRFDMNTLPFVSKKVRKTLLDLGRGKSAYLINEYPDVSYSNLVELLATYTGADEKELVLGAGADGMLDVIGKTFLEQSDSVVVSVPTYSMYRIVSETYGAKVRSVARKKEYLLDPDEIIATAKESNAKLVFICNPNSPTGNLSEVSDLKRIAEGIDAILVVDEAYFEFCGKSSYPKLAEVENVIIVRTLSKGFGLAGARVGYTIAPLKIAKEMNKVRPPNSISSLALAAAEAALSKEGIEEMRRNVGKIMRLKVKLERSLSGLGFYCYPSVANFIMLQTSQGLASKIALELMKRGLVLRDFSKKQYAEGCLRITVRSKAENERLVAAIADLTKPNYDGVIFDIDGVLVDVSKSYRKAIAAVASSKLGREVLETEIEGIKQIKGFNNDWDTTYALAYGINDPSKIPRDSGEYKEIVKEFQKVYFGTRENPGLMKNELLMIKKATLGKLKNAGLKIAVATSRPRAEALAALRPFIGEYIEKSAIIALEDVPREKPAPDPLLKAKAVLGAKNPIYVGDNISDLAAAGAAEMPIVIIGKNPGPGAAKLGAEFYFSDVNLITKIVVRE